MNFSSYKQEQSQTVGQALASPCATHVLQPPRQHVLSLGKLCMQNCVVLRNSKGIQYVLLCLPDCIYMFQSRSVYPSAYNASVQSLHG